MRRTLRHAAWITVLALGTSLSATPMFGSTGSHGSGPSQGGGMQNRNRDMERHDNRGRDRHEDRDRDRHDDRDRDRHDRHDKNDKHKDKHDHDRDR